MTPGVANTLYHVGSDSLGLATGVGERQSHAFWNSLDERLRGVPTFAFANRRVFLALGNSPVLAGPKRLAARCCNIYACGSCLDYYGVRDRLAVGEPGSIPILQQLMCDAAKVITI